MRNPPMEIINPSSQFIPLGGYGQKKNPRNRPRETLNTVSTTKKNGLSLTWNPAAVRANCERIRPLRRKKYH
jgi:hypothetical protein